MSFVLLFAACATSRVSVVEGGARQGLDTPHVHQRGDEPASEPRQIQQPVIRQQVIQESPQARLLPVGMRELSEGRWLLLFPARPPHAALELLSLEEVRPFLTIFASLGPRPRLHLLEWPGADNMGQGVASPWESKLREEFLSRVGPPLLPLPESLTSSRLFLALQLSTRYMGEGIREAAIALFSSPAFVLSVCLSIAVYFAAWLAPEPLFSKAFAATMTLRLSLAMGLAEVGHVALASLRLYQEAQAASSPQQLEAASARFGKSMGGTSLRLLVTVATLGVSRLIPQVPESGIWRQLPPVTPEGLVLLEQSAATAQAASNGALIVSGVAAGTATYSILSDAPKPPTRYGKPHTRENPTHNEAIERELASREAAGHTSLRKDRVQRNAAGKRVYDDAPVGEVRFRRPDASSVRPDGVRHNTNYVSNPRDLKRELEAFDAMKRADPKAIHELYMLDGTLVSRYVPAGIGFP
ncbi:hypothetical protein D187_005121 [Cystobacter fuscus DSM 2262]|uniref:Uncharacterized protein n=1 Tax=Cystobacter fuscus (strain ATCC 25194 / DSM 2262 / NBRC 100088 / M29) TaxID=1242864 RepID=S9R4Y6_CYSF2|nr:hypothetical protein [Cystobacter fuscus]EPX63988.1 hypothetical protein D187_005121 [Cystobacter fuscus DSM 2262]